MELFGARTCIRVVFVVMVTCWHKAFPGASPCPCAHRPGSKPRNCLKTMARLEIRAKGGGKGLYIYYQNKGGRLQTMARGLILRIRFITRSGMVRIWEKDETLTCSWDVLCRGGDDREVFRLPLVSQS